MKYLFLLFLFSTVCAMEVKDHEGRQLVEIDTSQISSIQEAHTILTELSLWDAISPKLITPQMALLIKKARKECHDYVKKEEKMQFLVLKRKRN